MSNTLSRRGFASVPAVAERASAAVAEQASRLAALEQSQASCLSPVATPIPFEPRLALPETRVTTLPSGLRVATEAHPGAATASVAVLFDAGSRFEGATTVGTAHFLEHLAFKGTKRRSMATIEQEIEDMGAHLNAHTSREITAYYAMCMKQDVGQVTDLLADILQNSTYSEAAIERERNVILKEMAEVEGDAQEMVHDHLHATAFQHSPLAEPILGSRDNVMSISKADLENYVKSHYTAPRTVVTAAGAVDHDKFVADVAKQFDQLSEGGHSADELVASAPSVWTGSEVRIRDDYEADNKVKLAIGFEGASWHDPDSVPLMVLREMIGSYTAGATDGINSTSELAHRVAGNDLASHFNTSSTSYKDTGMFVVYAECDDAWGKSSELSWTISNMITKNIYTVEPSDVEKAKNTLKAMCLNGTEGTQTSALEIGNSILNYGRRIPLSEMFARIDAVDASTINRVAERFFYDKDPAIVAWGATQDVPDYQLFQRRSFWLRY